MRRLGLFPNYSYARTTRGFSRIFSIHIAILSVQLVNLELFSTTDGGTFSVQLAPSSC